MSTEVNVGGLRPPEGMISNKIPEGKCLFPDNVRRIACPIGIVQDVSSSARRVQPHQGIDARIRPGRRSSRLTRR